MKKAVMTHSHIEIRGGEKLLSPRTTDYSSRKFYLLTREGFRGSQTPQNRRKTKTENHKGRIENKNPENSFNLKERR